MALRIAVAGGTGVVGRYVVDAITAQGHESVAMSRASGVDLVTGQGLERALEGVDVVIDTLNTPSLSAGKATEFFVTTMRNLVSAAERHGFSRIVTLSIVGIDRASDYGYYRAKLAQEAEVAKTTVPYTIVRATQFHEFPAQVMRRAAAGRIALVPKMPVQTVSARSVAGVLVDAATASSSGLVNVAGPEVHELDDLARQIVTHLGLRRRVVGVSHVPRMKAAANGALLAPSGSLIVGPDFRSWLQSGQFPSDFLER
jgi:uncharacterized protein YbjT (DUF2867 family)